MSKREPVQDGNLKAYVDEFDKRFKELLGTVKIVERPATVIHKIPGVPNPGVGDIMISAAKMHERWERSSTAAATDWGEGASNPSADPIAEALKADKKRVDRFNEAERAGKWRKKMSRLKADDVFAGVQGAIETGAYAGGIKAKSAKTLRRFEVLQPKIKALKTTIRAMPQDTDEQRKARMLAARSGMLAIGKE